jgi:hypothetical protein
MTAQYIRQVSLVVGSETSVIDLSEMQIKFEVLRGDAQTPNTCSARVYNLSAQTANRLKSGEFTAIVLKGGYQDNFGVIFQGTVKYVYFGHETSISSYVDIVAADGDEAYQYATVNLSLAAGSKPQDHLNVALKSMAEYDVQFDTGIGHKLTGNNLPRGKVFYGMARDVLRQTAADQGMTWSIQDGSLNMILQTSYRPGDAVVLTSATGLIGFPEQTQNGIHVKCLLNPAIKIGGLIKIDNASVQRYNFDLSMTGDKTNFMIPELSADGLYKVLFVNHAGDTRGNDFYSNITCLSINPTIAPTAEIQSGRAIVGPVPAGPVNPYNGA